MEKKPYLTEQEQRELKELDRIFSAAEREEEGDVAHAPRDTRREAPADAERYVRR